MVEATTPKPEEGEATTPDGKEAITSGNHEKASPEEMKSIVAERDKLKGQVETLGKQLGEQRTLQSQADRKRKVAEIEREKLEKTLEKIRSGEISPDEEIPQDETPTERESRLQARIKIQNLILENPDYQELMKQDITLREVIKNNPFALISENYFDVDDAVEQLREKFDARINALKTQPKEKQGESGTEFEAGLSQPREESGKIPVKQNTPQTPDEKLEASIRNKIKVL